MSAAGGRDAARVIAEAVLYEGYLLYPYRPSSVKNRQRWTFGGICPPAYSAQAGGGSDRSSFGVQCLLQGDAQTTLNIDVRFLQLCDRLVARAPDADEQEAGGESGKQPFYVEQLTVGARNFRPWQEANECEVAVQTPTLGAWAMQAQPLRRCFECEGGCTDEPIYGEGGGLAGRVERRRMPLQGLVEAELQEVGEGLFKLSVRVENQTSLPAAKTCNRDAALLHSLISAHAIVTANGGEMVSLLDPPGELAEAAAGCVNEGVYPVLVGSPGERSTMLASPIILYDYPEIAAESPGDLFDGTEIDEILTLRILTMTDEEKREAAECDERARALLERTEALSWQELAQLHGVMRRIRDGEGEAGEQAL
jgi:hypothetical protein